MRALLRSNHPAETYEVADNAMQQVPGTVAGLAAYGRALYRKAELPKAEKAWHDALAIDPKNATALRGLARMRSLIAQFKSAQTYTAMAHRLSPDDPELTAAFAGSLHGPERIAMLRSALAIYDPDSREARSLRASISSEEALGDVHTRKLKSEYRPYEIKLMELLSGPNRLRGFALKVSFNGEHPATLLLDTGASGIALAPRLAEKFGLRQVGSESHEVTGIGNGDARSGFAFLASSVQIGDVEFQDYPVAVFDTAKSPDFDGLIGADVFARFLVNIDFPNRTLSLQPFSKDDAPKEEAHSGPTDARPLPPGLFRVYRTGHMLLVPSFVNTDPSPHLFLIDSGAFSNIIDPAVARNSTKTYSDSRMIVKGVQGSVKGVARADEATLAFAGFRQKNPGLIAIDMSRQSNDMGIAIDGILGRTVLNNLKVTIDYRDGGVGFVYNQH